MESYQPQTPLSIHQQDGVPKTKSRTGEARVCRQRVVIYVDRVRKDVAVEEEEKYGDTVFAMRGREVRANYGDPQGGSFEDLAALLGPSRVPWERISTVWAEKIWSTVIAPGQPRVQKYF
jgi:hypothetical protein